MGQRPPKASEYCGLTKYPGLGVWKPVWKLRFVQWPLLGLSDSLWASTVGLVLCRNLLQSFLHVFLPLVGSRDLTLVACLGHGGVLLHGRWQSSPSSRQSLRQSTVNLRLFVHGYLLLV